MQTRYIITAAIIIGGPLLFTSQIEPEAAKSGSTGNAAVVAVAPAPGVAPATGGGAVVTTMAGVAVAAIAPDSMRARPEGVDTAASIDSVATLADASAADLASTGSEASASSFAAPFSLAAADAGSGGVFDRTALRDDNAMLFAGGAFGAGGGAFGAGGTVGAGGAAAMSDPVAFAASGQAQLVSSVPEPASWISFIVGLGLIGVNARRNPRLRSVSA